MTAKQILAHSSYLKRAMKIGVSKMEVFDFKENWCDENRIIANLIKSKAGQHLIPPILDVGSGLGDIAYNSFPEKEAVCIDVNEIKENEFPISKNHQRKQINFFDYKPDRQFKTVFISHTLQFIDEDVEKLNNKISELNPDCIIMVLNENNDFIGKIIEWTEINSENPNPEIHLTNFPTGYSLIKRIPFKAKLSCPDFDKLARQISYLMVVDLKDMIEELKIFLKEKLHGQPMFSFNQAIEIYYKDV